MNMDFWHSNARKCILVISLLLLAAGVVWQLHPFDRNWGSLSSPETAPPDLLAATQIPAATAEASAGGAAAKLPAVGTVALPTPPTGPWPLWVAVTRDVRLFGGLQRLDEKVPQGSILRVLGGDSDRLLVYYAGDGDERGAAEGLIDAVDVAGSRAPKWVMVRRGMMAVRSAPDVSSPVVIWLRHGEVLEVLEDAGTLLRVFYRGNGRERDTIEGWADIENLVAAGPALTAESRGVQWLDRARIASIRSGNGVWLTVPYRTQLDGSRSATSNCGPASIGMALEYLHLLATNEELRSIALQLQDTSDPDTGFAIEYLQRTVELLGMKGFDLYEGEKFKRWRIEDLRSQIVRGHPVVTQLRFRMMPGRSNSDYLEDHYVVFCGVQGNDFIYNDPVDTDGPGYGRLISAEQLEQAWGSSYFPFAAFAVGLVE